MVRMSDILKKALEKKKEAEKPSSQQREALPKTDSSVPSSLPGDAVKKEISPEPDKYNVRKIVGKKENAEKNAREEKVSVINISSLIAKKASKEESIRLYDELIYVMKETLRNLSEGNSMESKKFTDKIEIIVDQLSLENEYLLMLAFIKDSIDSNYLLCHSVNVCIYSIEVGLGLSYEKTRLVELGVSALLHDLGMDKYLDLVQQNRKLTAEEYNRIKEHTAQGFQMLGNNNIFKITRQVAYQHHERIDGSGYPLGKDEESISEYSKIVSLVDVYEAMIHSRLHRNRLPLMAVAQEILNNKNKFEYKLIKILIEQIGIFPVGSFVRLNNKEVVQVIKLNRGIPLRPVVRIILDPEGKQVTEKKIVDLTTQPTVYIKDEEKINWDSVML